MFKSIGHLAISLAVSALLGGMVFSAPAVAATTKTPPAVSSSSPGMEDSVKGKKGRLSPEQRVEKRIKELHDRLRITDAQEKEWNNVAATMRDNEKSMHDLVMERHGKAAARTAIEDLESYQKITAAHAERLGKFIAVFQPLYQAMSEEQKKNADAVFGRFEGHGRHHRKADKGGSNTQ